jgi:hypothetical protein
MRGLPRLHGSRAQPQAVGDAGPEGLDQHVGRLAKVEQKIAPLGRLEIEHDALLAAVEIAEEHGGRPVEEANVAAGVAFARRLDLDHLGAVIGERHGQVRARQERGEVDDAQVRKLHDGT